MALLFTGSHSATWDGGLSRVDFLRCASGIRVELMNYRGGVGGAIRKQRGRDSVGSMCDADDVVFNIDGGAPFLGGESDPDRLLMAAVFREPSLIYIADYEHADFVDPAHEGLFTAMLDLMDSSKRLTIGSLVSALRPTEWLERLGGRRGLRELLCKAPEEAIDRVVTDLTIALTTLPPVAADPVVVEALDLLDADEVEEVPDTKWELGR